MRRFPDPLWVDDGATDVGAYRNVDSCAPTLDDFGHCVPPGRQFTLSCKTLTMVDFAAINTGASLRAPRSSDSDEKRVPSTS